jgi:hypothetical protein
MTAAVKRFAATPCSACSELKVCGGLESDNSLFGCLSRCQTIGKCRTDWVCPCRLDEYVQRKQEVDGFEFRLNETLHGPQLRMPVYIPKIHHKYRRVSEPSVEFVAISTFSVFKLSSNQYASRFASPKAFRQELRVREDANVLLLSIAKDFILEPFWRHHKEAAPKLTKLNLMGITVPNFSFFNDAPRYHTLYNRKRMVLAAECLSSAGVPVVPHLNAENSTDWDFWESLLREQPHLRYVVKEFKTGNSNREKGIRAIHQLEDLQQKIGRPLHPILVSASQFVEVAAKVFSHFTIIDSAPAMRAINRIRLSVRGDRLVEHAVRTDLGEPVDNLLEKNIQACKSSLVRRIQVARETTTDQLNFELGVEHELKCPHCLRALTELEFGTRLVAGKRVRQSWCRECRGSR